jgi:hypothetical protein
VLRVGARAALHARPGPGRLGRIARSEGLGLPALKALHAVLAVKDERGSAHRLRRSSILDGCACGMRLRQRRQSRLCR